jgi:hypothetical protein
MHFQIHTRYANAGSLMRSQCWPGPGPATWGLGNKNMNANQTRIAGQAQAGEYADNSDQVSSRI